MKKKGSGNGKRCSVLVLMLLVVSVSASFAQINIIETPSAEVCKEDRLFFQQGVKISDRTFQASTIFTWGLGKNFQAGFNINQLTFNTRPHSRNVIIESSQPEYNPDLLVNAQKGIEPNEWMKFGLGTQTGINVARHRSDLRLLNFSYLNSEFQIPETNNRIMLAAYYANEAYAGEGSNWGWMAGAQKELRKDKFSLVADYFSGTNSMSVINMGVEIALPKSWHLNVAAQLPSPGSGNNHGGLIQFSRK
jgi:hypothetical protein